MSASPWQLERHEDGLLELVFDVDGERMNVLRADNLEALRETLNETRGLSGVLGLVIASRKPGCFVAGADISAIADVEDESEAARGAQLGQSVFAELEALPFPTAALIDGVCLGGGLELALACDYRFASRSPQTRMALPEVLLGILPGFGGTQRLPRIVGIPAALDVMLTGRNLSALRARRMGLVDEIAAAEQLPDVARQFFSGRRRRRPRPRMQRWLDSLIRSVPPIRRTVLGKARATVRARAGDAYPAPFAILQSVEAGLVGPVQAGFAREAELVGTLVVSKVSKSLVRLFQLSERAAKSDVKDGIERAWVAGAGVMGAGIAGLLAEKGVRTRLFDPAPAALESAVGNLRKRAKRRARSSGARADEVTSLLEPTATRNGFAGRDLVLEAVVERLDVKQELLREAEQRIPADSILATNTSSLDLDEIGSVLTRPERLVGIHFFNPVHRMRLIEIVVGTKTDREVIARSVALAKRLGKVPVVVKSCPGFLVNRLLTPYLLEAELMVAEGVRPDLLDRALKDAGMPMGPIELLDVVGLAVAGHVAETMAPALADRFVEAGLVGRLIERGELGKKSGTGFYYHGRGKPEVNDQGLGVTWQSDPPSAEWVDRLILPVVAEAMRCLDEQIVEDADTVDLAMCLGTGFLIPAGGPLRYAADRGYDVVVTAMDGLRARYGARFAVPDRLRQLTAAARPAPEAKQEGPACK